MFKNKLQWFGRRCEKAVLIKRKAWLTFQASGSRETFERYILARNYSVKMIRAE